MIYSIFYLQLNHKHYPQLTLYPTSDVVLGALTLGHPGLHLCSGGTVGNILSGRAGHVLCEIRHPLVFGSAGVLQCEFYW